MTIISKISKLGFQLELFQLNSTTTYWVSPYLCEWEDTPGRERVPGDWGIREKNTAYAKLRKLYSYIKNMGEQGERNSGSSCGETCQS